MAQVLGQLPRSTHPDLLVGFETSDDAGVFRLNADTALVQTVDFFTPMVDDPYDFGQIAVANAVSDLYAMGATPLTGLNIVGFPLDELPPSVLVAILRGGADKAAEAGLTVLGGHTVDDAEPKFGMAVTGLVHPARIWTNAGGQVGDRLVLTKPLGTGLLTTAIKRDLLDPELIALVTAQMATLNAAAAHAVRAVGAHAVTDVTGFGLLGHLLELTRASGVGARLRFSDIPLLPEALSLAKQDVVPGGTEKNLAHVKSRVDFVPGLNLPEQLVLADAQTSGGLLIAVAPGSCAALLEQLEADGVQAAEIGELIPGERLEVVL